MIRSRILSILILSSAIIALSAACQATGDDKKTISPGNLNASQQLFWDSLPKPVGFVNDFEGIFNAEEKHILDSMIRDFEKRTTIQMAIITFDITMTTPDNLEALTLRIAKYWGVGRKDKNNGVAIGISKGCRSLRIQNGYGIEKILTDEETKTIVDTDFIPRYREEKFFEGTYNGLSVLMKILERRNK